MGTYTRIPTGDILGNIMSIVDFFDKRKARDYEQQQKTLQADPNYQANQKAMQWNNFVRNNPDFIQQTTPEQYQSAKTEWFTGINLPKATKEEVSDFDKKRKALEAAVGPLTTDELKYLGGLGNARGKGAKSLTAQDILRESNTSTGEELFATANYDNPDLAVGTGYGKVVTEDPINTALNMRDTGTKRPLSLNQSVIFSGKPSSFDKKEGRLAGEAKRKEELDNAKLAITKGRMNLEKRKLELMSSKQLDDSKRALIDDYFKYIDRLSEGMGALTNQQEIQEQLIAVKRLMDEAQTGIGGGVAAPAPTQSPTTTTFDGTREQAIQFLIKEYGLTSQQAEKRVK